MGKRSKIKKERLRVWKSLSWNERIMIIIFLFVIWFGWGQFQFQDEEQHCETPCNSECCIL